MSYLILKLHPVLNGECVEHNKMTNKDLIIFYKNLLSMCQDHEMTREVKIIEGILLVLQSTQA